MSHNLTKSPCLVSDGQKQQNFVDRARIIPLTFVTLQNWHFVSFPLVHSIPLLSTLALTLSTHTVTTEHTTQSHNSTPCLTETSVCVFVKIFNKEPSQQFGVLFTEGSGLVSGLNICTSLRAQRRNWYKIIPFRTFTRFTPYSLWGS